MENIGKVYLMSILLCIIPSAAISGSHKVTVVVDGYTVDSTLSSPASLPLGTALVLVCRVSGIPQRQIKYSWTCPDGPCERPGYVGRKVVNDSILAVNITSNSDGGTYTCEVSRDEADGGYSQNYTLSVSGGHVIHSYGRLVHYHHVITRGDQLLPPGNETAPGRMDCIRTAPETARFRFFGGEQPNNNLVLYQSDDDGDQMATLFFNRAYLLMNNFTAEYSCHDDTYILFYLSPGTLSNVTIMRAVPSTTDVRIVLNDIPSDIGRTIVGYERHDLGVTLQGEYANIGRRTEHTFTSLVPGARYTVVVQGLTASPNGGQRSQHVTRRDFTTKVKEPSAPRYPCIIGDDTDGIQLNWIPPLESNGDVYYLIVYSDGNRTLSVNTSSESTYFNLTGLQRGVTYNITVVAVNSAGRSDTGTVLKYTHSAQINTPSQTSPTSLQISSTGVVIVVAVVIIVILLVIITILSVLLVLKRKKQPPTVQCEQVNMSEIYDGVDDIVKTNQDYEEVDVSKMDADVMTSKDYQKLNVRKMDPLGDKVMTMKSNLGLNASKKNDAVICEEDYEEIVTERMDETTPYAWLK